MNLENDELENIKKDILIAEKDISNLLNIYEDLQIIVDSQANILDSIENNIISGSSDTEEATEILVESSKESKKKKKFIFKIVGGSIICIPIMCTPVFLPILGAKVVLGSLLGTTGIGTSIYHATKKI